jgi:hypothetical protein
MLKGLPNFPKNYLNNDNSYVAIKSNTSFWSLNLAKAGLFSCFPASFICNVIVFFQTDLSLKNRIMLPLTPAVYLVCMMIVPKDGNLSYHFSSIRRMMLKEINLLNRARLLAPIIIQTSEFKKDFYLIKNKISKTCDKPY